MTLQTETAAPARALSLAGAPLAAPTPRVVDRGCVVRGDRDCA